MKKTKNRLSVNSTDHYDAIVIGSGIGGLTTAALLSCQGKRVLVIEKHYVAGGCATVFNRQGTAYEFDVGVHYIGDCGPNGLVPRILRSVGIDDIEWLEQDPQCYDRVYFPDMEFFFPKGFAQFRMNLLEAFPAEERGIDRYLALVKQVWMYLGIHEKPISALWVLPQCLMLLRYVNSTLAQFLDSCTDNPKLRAVLAAQLGVYHQAPSQAAVTGHAGVTAHFLQGAFYPKGGGKVLSNRLVDVIEACGGDVLLRAEVEEILVENQLVKGVRYRNKKGVHTKFAPSVISNADYKQTMLHMLAPEHVSADVRKKVENLKMAPAMLVVYLGVKRDFAEEGMTNSNLRIYPSYDLEEAYRSVEQGLFPERPHVFVGNATIKNPGDSSTAPPGITNLQLMSAVPSDPKAWGLSDAELSSGEYQNNPAYLAKKAEITEKVLLEAERVIPGLREAIVFQESSTPMTSYRYTGASDGSSYGLAMIPSQFLHHRPGPKTGIKGLYLCGANTRSGHGIFGAMTSAVEASAAVLANRHFVSQVLSSRVVYDDWMPGLSR